MAIQWRPNESSRIHRKNGLGSRGSPPANKSACANNSSHKETRAINAIGHKYGSWTVTKAATCTATGTETRTCANNSAHKETRSITAVGHKWGTWTTTKSATVMVEGAQERICSSCKAKETKTIAKLPSYTVKFNAKGGKEVANKIIKRDAAIGTLPTTTRTGYAFKGWYTAAKDGTKITKDTKVTKNATYYAQWTPNKYSVTYNANGGKIDNKTSVIKTVKYDAKYALPAAPTRSGYKFMGWYTAKKDGTKITASTTVKLKKDQTLYARWASVWTVKFDASGGKTPKNSVLVEKGKAVGTLSTPTRSGYKFVGWYTAKTGGTKITDKTKPSKNVTYYARWVAAWTVKFAANGGTVKLTSVLVEKSKAVGTLPKPTRSGYKFAGWYTAKTGGTKITEKTKPSKNMTYYARWNK